MRIGYLGAGTWGFTLASLLGSKGHEVVVWALPHEVEVLNRTREHPKLPGHPLQGNVRFTTDLKEVLQGAEMLIESVTSAGVRPVFEMVKAAGTPKCPIVLTSKGIEQNSGLLLTEVVRDVLGEEMRNLIGCLSGPSHAEEVVRGLPASVVCSAYAPEVMSLIQQAFVTLTFRVYPNADITGVSFGGAMKNIIAIACGISDGLGFGDNAKAALMTRGLHEIRRLGERRGCLEQTLNGLAGLGDLCVTCLSHHSRNYRFGRLLAQGLDPESALKQIGMAVEGAYTCLSAIQDAHGKGVELPICQGVYSIIYEGKSPQQAVHELMQRAVKEEHL
jgi:glycerol-3-phosphate dehydrogenase (NAD(P)+)